MTPLTSARPSARSTAWMMWSVSSRVMADESSWAIFCTSRWSVPFGKASYTGLTSSSPETVGTTAPLLSWVLAMVPPVERTTMWWTVAFSVGLCCGSGEPLPLFVEFSWHPDRSSLMVRVAPTARSERRLMCDDVMGISFMECTDGLQTG